MATNQKIKFAWLKDALADKGLQQKDLAKAWGCDSAVVSRFIQVGEPKLTWDRAMSLARLLGWELEELQTRIVGNIPPKTGRRGQVDARSSAAHDPQSRGAVLAELKSAVEKARASLPDDTIEVHIVSKREEQI